MIGGTVFVTVGTTKFESLIKTVNEENILRLLSEKGYEKVIFQIGKGEFIPEEGTRFGLKVSVFRLKKSIQTYFESADLVISHAGAGSCLEALGAKKPLITVINEILMNNHQSELAEELALNGYSLCCNTNNLYETLLSFNKFNLKEYKPGNPKLFSDYLNSVILITGKD